MLFFSLLAAFGDIKPIPQPTNLAPSKWVIIGPYANPYGANGREKILLEDLLSEEAKLRLVPGKTVKGCTAMQVVGDEFAGIDFNKAFGGGQHDNMVAYAYSEISSPNAQNLDVDFGSDDGAMVWLNGVEIHRYIGGRGVDLDSDHFNAPINKGVNRIHVKIENGTGGWGFAMRLMDAKGRTAAKLRHLRANLYDRDLGPEEGGFLLTNKFPNIVWRRADASLVIAPKPIVVKWYGPDFKETKTPTIDGRYFAYVESETVDGYVYKRILTFAKGPDYLGGVWPLPPFTDTPMLFQQSDLGYDTRPYNEAQRKEITRHALFSTYDYLLRTEGGAVLTGAMLDMKDEPVSPKPSWLYSGFVRNNVNLLNLRMKIENRTPKPLIPPQVLQASAPELKNGTEDEAGIQPGTIEKLRSLCQEWIKADPNGFVVHVSRHGVTVMEEGFGGWDANHKFYPASIGKSIEGLTFSRAVDQGLLSFDDPVSRVFPDWGTGNGKDVTFRRLMAHLSGVLPGEELNGLHNIYLDNNCMVQDLALASPGIRFSYTGVNFALCARALELTTGEQMNHIMYRDLLSPFGEDVEHVDMGAGAFYTPRYLAKVGRMLLQDGTYGRYRFFSHGFVKKLMPVRMADYIPTLKDKGMTAGPGLDWMIDRIESEEKPLLGTHVVGHGSGSNSVWRVDFDHDLVIVIGRDRENDYSLTNDYIARFIKTVADGLR